MLIDDLCDQLLPSAANFRVVDVRIGLGYTAVQLDYGTCGLAYTFRDAAGSRCSVLEQAGTFVGRPAIDLAGLAKSSHLISAALGLAALNALTEMPPGDEADALDLISIDPDDEVGMVGNFVPLVAALRTRVRKLHVFERNPPPQSGLLPAERAAEVLPRCQVALITATSLLNRTIDGLLEHCRQARDVVVLGPSTPLRPEFFADRGVTILSGIYVTDVARALRIISEGGGTPQMKSAVRKVSMRIHPPRNGKTMNGTSERDCRQG